MWSFSQKFSGTHRSVEPPSSGARTSALTSQGEVVQALRPAPLVAASVTVTSRGAQPASPAASQVSKLRPQPSQWCVTATPPVTQAQAVTSTATVQR